MRYLLRSNRSTTNLFIISFLSRTLDFSPFFLDLYANDFTVLARQVLVQSSSSSKARRKRVMNQTMFDVPDPLVVHVLLLTHEFNMIIPHSRYPQCDCPCFLCAQNTPLFDFMQSAGPGRCLIVFTGFIQCCNVTNSIVPFFPFQGFFCRYYKSEATTTIITIFTYAA